MCLFQDKSEPDKLNNKYITEQMMALRGNSG